ARGELLPRAGRAVEDEDRVGDVPGRVPAGLAVGRVVDAQRVHPLPAGEGEVREREVAGDRRHTGDRLRRGARGGGGGGGGGGADGEVGAGGAGGGAFGSSSGDPHAARTARRAKRFMPRRLRRSWQRAATEAEGLRAGGGLALPCRSMSTISPHP